MIPVAPHFIESIPERLRLKKTTTPMWTQGGKIVQDEINDPYLTDNDVWYLLTDELKADYIYLYPKEIQWEMMEGLQEMYPYLHFGWIHNVFPLFLFAQEAYA